MKHRNKTINLDTWSEFPPDILPDLAKFVSLPIYYVTLRTDICQHFKLNIYDVKIETFIACQIHSMYV